MRFPIAPICVVIALMTAPGCATRQPPAHRGLAPDFTATYARHAVAADHPLASEAGLEVLRADGNAVDAAVATSFALSVVRPFSCGIGGGGFMVVHFDRPTQPGLARTHHQGVMPMIQYAEPPRRAIAINYRETAPGGSTPDMFARDGQPTGAASPSRAGGLAAGVPGTVAGLLRAQEWYGRLSREEALAPAIRLAERGFEADEAYVRAAQNVARDFGAHPAWQERFAFVWERYLLRGQVGVGDIIHVPEQAEALRLIARDGATAFYDGPIAEAIVRAVRADGGIMTRQDLRGYEAQQVEPLRFEHAGRNVLTMPPPSSGGVTMALALGLLERTWKPVPASNVVTPDAFPLLDSGLRPEFVGDSVGARMTGGRGWSMQWRDALLFGCFQAAFADRAAWLGDPDFVDVPVERLLSGAYLDARARLIDVHAGARQPEHYLDPAARVELSEGGGTSHISVVDRWGNAVACTETINLEFGSLLAVPEYGFILNNQMDDFTSRVGEPNAFGLRQSARNLPAPGKRPLSSMTPTIVLDQAGRVEIVAGASGGPRIITGTTLAILHALHGWSAGEAVAAPRFHHQWLPARLDMEPAYARVDWRASVMAPWTLMDEGQRARGYEVREVERLCVVQMVRREGTGWQAASDPRKGGRPAGD